jgi:hypothetical protein
MFPAFLLQLIIVLVIVGLVLWIITMIPIDPFIVRVIRVVVIVAVCLWLLSLVTGYMPIAPVRR